MFKNIITSINPFATHLKIGLALAAAFLIGYLYIEAGRYEGKWLAAEGEVSKHKGKIEEWRSANAVLFQAINIQNKALESLAEANKAAKLKLAEANKKAQAIAVVRQAQKNQAEKGVSALRTCQESIIKAKSDLMGSSL